MKIKAILISAFVAAIVVLALPTASARAQATAQSIKDKAVGEWQLVSVAAGDMEPYGNRPKGMLYIGNDDRFSVIVIGDSKHIAFFGTYTVDERDSSLNLHIEDTTSNAGPESNHKWLITFNGNEMTHNRATPSGARGTVTAVWKRVD